MAPSIMAGIPALKSDYTQLRSRMDKAVGDFQTNLGSIRTGRASIHMLDQVKVDYYGTPTPLNQVGQITTPDANMIVIAPWDASLIVEIEKSLRTSDLGFNPNNDGKIVRVPVPPMTEDHRTAVRNIRRDGNDLIKKAAKDKKISEDEEKRSLDEIQKLTDEEIKKMEEMAKKKEAEVMQV